jgi:hypothetical protein
MTNPFEHLTDDEIINLLKVEYHRLAEALGAYSLAESNIRYLRQQCPHNEKQSWTDSDGFSGSFKVEKCLICGLQKDYGL